MKQPETTSCDGLITYLTGELSDMQRKRFEKHLASCVSCQEEAHVWNEVWGRLTDGLILLDPPADLKDDVMRSIDDDYQHDDADYKNDHFQEGRTLNIRTFSKSNKGLLARSLKWGIGVAVVLIAFMSGWFAKETQLKLPDIEASAQTPSSIETLFHLSADRGNGKFADSPRAYGVACLVRSENEERFVVYIFGSPPTQDDEAYQVWLWKDGQRTNAGTFKVGNSGIGIMTLPLNEGLDDIDAVGVTLEPNNRSVEPRGPKMFGSEAAAPTGKA